MKSYTRDAAQVVSSELEHIDRKDSDKIAGLAFSGGGIRSAAFGMGVMQALVADDKLGRFDYLSTVSGGGYLGSSLTWFLSRKMDNGESYGTKVNNFPFGQKRKGNRESNENSILDYIRQHGNYLVPGSGLNFLSFVAVTLRTMLLSFAIYFALVTSAWCLIFLFIGLPFIGIEQASIPFVCLQLIIGLAILWLGISWFYSIITFFKLDRYLLSVRIQKILGWILLLIIVLAVVALLPLLHDYIGTIAVNLLGLEESALHIRNYAGTGLSVSSIGIGTVLAFMSYLRQLRSYGSGLKSWQIVASSIFLLFGILYGSYILGVHLQLSAPALIFPFIGLAVLLGLLCNLNHFGLNRMYRDRLMETFMPDRSGSYTGRWKPALDADKAGLSKMCQAPNQRPFHLVNCNVVLVDSNDAKFRGRCGDSFTLSPLYCGSHATGWRSTHAYMKNLFHRGMTLPTAMAISGAAANPNAGVSGRGLTTNRFVSTLMSLLSLRLGYWADNPRFAPNKTPPNYIYPGIKGGLSLTGGLSEHDRMLELSDGGHFENLAIYELLRRRLDLIVVCDAGCDGGFTFSDLANVVERSRVDFGVTIKFKPEYSLAKLVPGSSNEDFPSEAENYLTAARGFAIATVQYALRKGEDEAKAGHLIYIKPTLIKNLSADVIGYKKQEIDFPHQTTLDQFFDEQQFEAYRELGYYLGWNMLEDTVSQALFAEADNPTAMAS